MNHAVVVVVTVVLLYMYMYCCIVSMFSQQFYFIDIVPSFVFVVFVVSRATFCVGERCFR